MSSNPAPATGHGCSKKMASFIAIVTLKVFAILTWLLAQEGAVQKKANAGQQLLELSRDEPSPYFVGHSGGRDMNSTGQFKTHWPEYNKPPWVPCPTQNISKGLTQMLPMIQRCTCPDNLNVDGMPAQECYLRVQGEFLIMRETRFEISGPVVAYEFDKNNEYGKFSSLKLQPGDIVIDIGANLGFFSLSVARHYPYVKIFSIELNPKTFSFLQQNILINGAQSVVSAFNTALTHDARTVSLSNCNGVSMAAHQSETDEECASGQVSSASPAHIAVGTVTFDEFITQHKIGRIALLKIDCEGCEEEVLPLLPRESIQSITGECHPTRFANISAAWALCCKRCPSCQKCPTKPWEIESMLCKRQQKLASQNSSACRETLKEGARKGVLLGFVVQVLLQRKKILTVVELQRNPVVKDILESP
eukprot:gnl/MRDRNA2_/MRDRNA2_187641_c0_seq1.p1 gnl/MRDRNA2_/MRDRNA2_187641_c0~~gnl/MRDRNA2_/MRDRNA2_187641_c0_seq1.p1  ORF type:complete len:420 (+),score=62.17 gnl/MRDRNA2_/MRDRNA2_187641_c0_seq1:121-1380(+)